MLHKAYSLIVSGTTFLPIWFQYRTLVNIQKAWNLTFAYSLNGGSCKTLQTRYKHITPTPNMKCHQTEQSTRGRSAGGIVISQRAFTAFLFWVCEILQDFRSPKQALINAFYYVCKPITRLATAKLLHFFYITKYPTQKSAFHSAACIFFLSHI